jgi:hypothetical protein
MKLFITLVAFLICAALMTTSAIAQYLTEDFEGAWSGDPAAPAGWTQSRVVLIGDGVPEPISTNGEKDWEQNVWSGTAWSKVPSSTGTQPNGAQSGFGVLWMNDYFFGSQPSAFGSRRLESPVMNLASSTSPFVKFYLFCAYGSDRVLLRVEASSNGGSTWEPIMFVPPNADTAAGPASTYPWQPINVMIPPAYRTVNAKIAIAMTNTWGTQNIWIDNLTVEEFTPTTITSAGSGNWNVPATWVGGVIPNANNHVVIATGHTVSGNVNTMRCQNLTVDGTLNYGTTTTTHLFHAFGDVTVNAGGVLNSYSSTTGKKFYVGGIFTNNGTADFSVSGATLVFLGGKPATVSGSGTYTAGHIRNVWHAQSGGVTYNAAVTISNTAAMYVGAVNPNGNLTIGNSGTSTSQTIEIGQGSLASAPMWGTGVTRSITYLTPQSVAGILYAPAASTRMTGEEIEDVSGTRTVSGSLTLNRHGNVQLSTPVTVGTASTGGLTLTRGILVTTPTNLLTLNSFIAGPTGTAPSTATPPITHGSYVSGPMRINFPSSGTTARNFALGVGAAFNGSVPNSNVLKTVNVNAGATAWAGQTITASIEAAPSGTTNPPLTGTMGVGTYRLNLNGGPDLSSTATVAIRGRNSTFGNSDNLVGTQADLRVAQATSASGAWTERSATSGSGAFTDDTDYPRTTATAAPGPIAPLATNGEYFALATTSVSMTYDSSNAYHPTLDAVAPGSTNQVILGVRVYTTGGLSPLSLTQLTLNTSGTTNTVDLTNAKVYYTGTSSTFATTTQFGSTVTSPSGTFMVNGTQTLASGTNYFWLTYDIASGATVDNYVDAQSTGMIVGGISRTPTVTDPAGARQIRLQVTIGTGTSTQRYPLGMYYGYQRSASLYTAAEATIPGNVNSVAWYIATLTAHANGPMKIYLKHTSNSTLTADTWANMISGATQVYDASATFVAGNWQTFSLTAPFAYNGVDNLLVLVETNYGGTGGEGSTAKAIRYSTATNQHQYWEADNSPPAGNGNVTSNRPNIQITFGPPPACPSPASLTATAITATSANIGWTAGGSETAWEYVYGVSPVPPPSGSGTATTSNPTSLTGLTSATAYQFYVRADCGGGSFSAWSGPYSFTTPCEAVTTFPWGPQIFMGTFPPSCWSRYTGLLANPSTLTSTTSGWNQARWRHVSTADSAARLNIWSTTTRYWLMTPQIDLGPSPPALQLEFDMSLNAYNTSNPPGTTGTDDKFAVVISTDGGTTWTSTNTLRLWDNAGSPYVYNDINYLGERVTISLAAYTGVIMIGFYGESTVSNADNDLMIDNVKIKIAAVKDIQVASVSLSPTTPTVGSPVTVSAAIVNNGSEANPSSVPLTYKVGSAPGSSGDGTAQTFAPAWSGNTATVTFTTTYTPVASGSLTMYVRSFYTGDEDTTNNTALTTTTVLPVGTLLYESFESTTFPPTGWVREDLNGSPTWARSTAAPKTGVGHARYAYSTTVAANDWMISPGVALTAGSPYRISYWYKAASAAYPEAMKVAVGTSQNAASMTTLLADHPTITVTSYTKNTITFTPSSSGTYYIGFHCYSAADMWNLDLDEILVAIPPAVDLSLKTWSQSSGLPTPEPPGGAIVSFAPRKPESEKEAIGVAMLEPLTAGTRAIEGTQPVLPSGVGNVDEQTEIFSVNAKGVLENLGLNASTYTLNWSVEGAAQTPYSGPSVASGATDTATVSYTGSSRGTFFAAATVTAAGDAISDNDSLATRLRIYPASFNRTIYDRGDNTVDTYVGWNSLTTRMKAGVRFSATATRRLAGVDFICRTESVTGSGVWEVQVRAAGVSTSAPGAVLYSRSFTGVAYNPSGEDGAYVTFPFDETAPVISTGTDYWITIKAPAGILYPGGTHGSGFTAGRSFYEGSTDTTVWNALVISAVEYAWIMRSYDVTPSNSITINPSFSSGWNMIANPVTRDAGPPPTDSVKILYPTSSFPYAFKYTPGVGYEQEFRMANKRGYWGKFPGAGSTSITGGARTLDTIPVVSGWNMVGSISSNVDTSTITSSPAGIRQSNWFGYNGGYSASAQIVPGKAYWVKASQAGSFYFQGGAMHMSKGTPADEIPAAHYNELTITDAEGNSQTLFFCADAANEIDLSWYQMPPAPPQGVFDARFESVDGGQLLETYPAQLDQAREFSVKVQTVAYPLTVRWKILGTDTREFTLSDAVGGRALAARTIEGEGSLQVDNHAITRLTLKVDGGNGVPTEYALYQNYPNPFNPTTSIKFALPLDSKVTVAIYNLLGQKVRSLVDADRKAGYHSVQWNGTDEFGHTVGSGVYFMRLDAKGSAGSTFVDVKKLMMLK